MDSYTCVSVLESRDEVYTTMTGSIGKDTDCLALDEDITFFATIGKQIDSFPWTEEQKQLLLEPELTVDEQEEPMPEDKTVERAKPISRDRAAIEMFMKTIIVNAVYNGPYMMGPHASISYFPSDLYLFCSRKLIYKDSEYVLQFFEWLLDTPFTDANGIGYYLNIHKREHTDQPNLISLIISARFQKMAIKIEMLKLLLSKFSPRLLAKKFARYISIATHESFGHIDDNEMLTYLLSLKVPLNPDDPELISWVSFENNERLLDYMFFDQKLDVNALCRGHSFLDHAIKNENYPAAEKLIAMNARFAFINT